MREAIFNAIPMCLKTAVSVGIGLFIAFIGLQNAGIIVGSSATLVDLVDFGGDFHHAGIQALLAIIGVIITAYMIAKGVKGAILFGILITWVLGILCQITNIYQVDAAAEAYSLLPDFSSGLNFSGLGNVFGQIFKADFSNIHVLDFIVVIFSFLFVDLFDTLGTLIGVASKADMLDKDGKLPRVKGALMADAIATTAGAVIGTTTVTTYVESASGVTAGGRTGLTAVTTGFLFLLSIFLSPIFMAIPSFATAPALIMVGFYMISNVVKINFEHMIEAIPAFLTIIAMPFAYSISEGIAIGVISYTVLTLTVQLGTKEKVKISPLMVVLTVLFILNYIFL